jgi:hypothetical protein
MLKREVIPILHSTGRLRHRRLRRSVAFGSKPSSMVVPYSSHPDPSGRPPTLPAKSRSGSNGFFWIRRRSLHHCQKLSSQTRSVPTKYWREILKRLGNALTPKLDHLTCAIAMESFFSSLKTERVCRKVYRSRNAARADVFDYIERFYNTTRRHSAIGYLSPVEFERTVGLT